MTAAEANAGQEATVETKMDKPDQTEKKAEAFPEKKTSEAQFELEEAAEAEPKKKVSEEIQPEKKESAEIQPAKKETVETKSEKKETAEIQPEKKEAVETKPEKEENVETKSEKKETAETQPEKKEAVETKNEKEETVDIKPEKKQAVETEPEKKKAVETKPEKEDTVETKPEKEETLETKPEKKQAVETEPEEKEAVETKPEKKEGVETNSEKKETMEKQPESKQSAETEPEKKMSPEAQPEKKEPEAKEPTEKPENKNEKTDSEKKTDASQNVTEDVTMEEKTKQIDSANKDGVAAESDTTSSDVTMAPIEENEDPAVEATMYLVQGKRHFLVQDFVSAVEALEKACQLLSAKYGDGASECAEALLYYGKALLELHRKQSGALNDMDNAEAEEDDDSSEEEQGGDDDEEAENSGDTQKSDEKSEETKDQQASPKDEEDLEKPDPALIDAKLDVPQGQSGDTEQEDAMEDASSDLQIAFEVLDLAKNIYKRDAEKNAELYLKAADCLLSLGEVGLESDNYTQAIEDFESCLRIQQEMLPSDSREIAETNYQLGLTYSFVNQYESSAAYFADAIQILKAKIKSLREVNEKIKASGEPRGSLDDDPVWRAEREIEEIESLLPEINSKLEDAKEMQKNGSSKNSELVQEVFNRTPEASPVKKAAVPVSKIGEGLIRRKRVKEEPEAGAPSEKKPKDD